MMISKWNLVVKLIVSPVRLVISLVDIGWTSETHRGKQDVMDNCSSSIWSLPMGAVRKRAVSRPFPVRFRPVFLQIQVDRVICSVDSGNIFALSCSVKLLQAVEYHPCSSNCHSPICCRILLIFWQHVEEYLGIRHPENICSIVDRFCPAFLLQTSFFNPRYVENEEKSKFEEIFVYFDLTDRSIGTI